MTCFATGELGSVYLELGLTDVAAHCLERELATLQPKDDEARRNADLLEANLLLARLEYERLDGRVVEMLGDGRLYTADSLQRGRLLIRRGIALFHVARARRAAPDEALQCLEEALGLQSLEPYERWRGGIALGEAWCLAGDAEESGRVLDETLDPGRGRPPPDIVAMGAALRVVLSAEKSREERTRAAAELELAYRALLDDWRRLPPRSGGFSFFVFEEYVRILSELMRVTLALDPGEQGKRKAFGYLLDAQAMQSLARKLAPEPVTIEELRGALCADGGGFLTYVPAQGESLLALFDGQRIEFVELEPDVALRAAQRDLRDALDGPPADRARCLEKNAALLLPQKARAILAGWKHLTILGTDWMEYVPFEDLPFDGGTLGEKLAIGYESSLSVALALTRRADRRSGPADGLRMVACPSPSKELTAEYGVQPLPLDRDQAKGMLACYPGEPELLFGEEARPSALLSTDSKHLAVLQVFAHGVAEYDDERPAAILLHGKTKAEALLRCAQIDSWAPPRLVVLCACATQRGPTRAGDGGAADFSGAFLGAGADCVLVSPRDLEFHATLEMMQLFHAALAKGAAPSEALQHARIQMRKENADGPHVPMRAVGLAHRPVLRR